MYLVIDETEEPSIAAELTPPILVAIQHGVASVYTVGDDDEFVLVTENGDHKLLPICEWAYE